MGVVPETLRQMDRVLPRPQGFPCHNSCRGPWGGQGGEFGMCLHCRAVPRLESDLDHPQRQQGDALQVS